MLYDDLINTNSVFSLRFPSIVVLALAISCQVAAPLAWVVLAKQAVLPACR